MQVPYDSLTVAALLKRAGVGRTSFYTHFSGMEALFAASVQQLGDGLLRAAQGQPGSWGFLRPFLQHVDSHRKVYSGFVGRLSAAVLERQMQALFARLLRDDLARRDLPEPGPVREAALMGTLWATLVAWIERRILLAPAALAESLVPLLDGLTREPSA